MNTKSAKEIATMREGGKRLATSLRWLRDQLKPGMTTSDVSKLAAKKLDELQLHPILIGYQGYNEVMCVSVNDAIVHGMPGQEVLKAGDLVKLDLTAAYKDLVVDSALTCYLGDQGKMPADIKRLIEGTEEALYAGIDAIRGDSTRVGDISAAVEKVLKKHKLGIIRDLVGHGVGHKIHEDPNVPNYGVAGTGPSLPAGATIAIEPMATLGGWEIDVLADGWTIGTRDHSLGAHFEHTVLITTKGAEILTRA